MSDQPPPYTYPFEFAGLSDRGAELTLSPDADERARIATWLGVLEVPGLEATVRLARLDDSVYRYDAEFIAEMVQACVVTLEPVPAHHTGTTTRRYRVLARASRRPPRDVEIDPGGDEDAPEALSSSVLDLAAPVLEELSLILDPYPRAQGVAFEPPKDEPRSADNPFAVLAKLKVTPPKEPGAGG